MNPQVSSIVDVIVDRSPEELIGGVLIALVFALGLSGLFHLLRHKVSDTSTLIICLALSSNLVAMTAGAAFIRYKFTGGRAQGSRSRSPEPPMPPPGMPGSRTGFMAGRILEAADLNGDRFLSSEEAGFAAAQFVKEVGEGGDSPIDEGRLRMAIAARFMSPPHMGMGMWRGRRRGVDGPPPLPPAPSDATKAIGEGRNRPDSQDAERSPGQDAEHSPGQEAEHSPH